MREKGEEPVTNRRIHPWLWRRGGLTRDRMDDLSRDEFVRRERVHRQILFSLV